MSVVLKFTALWNVVGHFRFCNHEANCCAASGTATTAYYICTRPPAGIFTSTAKTLFNVLLYRMDWPRVKSSYHAVILVFFVVASNYIMIILVH